MAKTLKTFPTTTRGSYPWDQWSDGRVWQLTQGEDYTVEDDAMRTGLYQAGSRLGMKVRTAIAEEGGSITFQFFDPAEEAKATKAAARSQKATAN